MVDSETDPDFFYADHPNWISLQLNWPDQRPDGFVNNARVCVELEQLRATGFISIMCEPNSLEMLREDL